MEAGGVWTNKYNMHSNTYFISQSIKDIDSYKYSKWTHAKVVDNLKLNLILHVPRHFSLETLNKWHLCNIPYWYIGMKIDDGNRGDIADGFKTLSDSRYFLDSRHTLHYNTEKRNLVFSNGTILSSIVLRKWSLASMHTRQIYIDMNCIWCLPHGVIKVAINPQGGEGYV